MKRSLILLLLVAFSFINTRAQQDTSLLYLRFPFLPSFKLTNVADSSSFTRNDLKKKKATIIMVFSPDCENCQEETQALKANIKLFKKAQIVMVSPLEFRILKKFYEDYGLAAYSNITVGRDPSYYLGTFYKVRSFPSIFVYDKKGDLKKTFIGSTPVEAIAAAIK